MRGAGECSHSTHRGEAAIDGAPECMRPTHRDKAAMDGAHGLEVFGSWEGLAAGLEGGFHAERSRVRGFDAEGAGNI